MRPTQHAQTSSARMRDVRAAIETDYLDGAAHGAEWREPDDGDYCKILNRSKEKLWIRTHFKH